MQQEHGPFEALNNPKEAQKKLSEEQRKIYSVIKNSVKTRQQEIDKKIKKMRCNTDAENVEKVQRLNRIIQYKHLKQFYEKMQP